MGLAQAPTTLDPRFATDAASARVCRLLYRSLAEVDERESRCRRCDLGAGRAGPLPVQLRPDAPAFATAHPSRPATSAATYESVLEPGDGLAAPRRARRHSRVDALAGRVQAGLTSCRAPTRCSRPTPRSASCQPQRSPRAATSMRRRSATGPSSWRDGRARGGLRVRRRDDGLEIDLLEVKDPTVRALKLLRGEIQLVQNDLPPELRRHLAAQPGSLSRRPARHHPSPTSASTSRSRRSRTAGARGHRARSHREAIVAALFRGWPSPPSRSCRPTTGPAPIFRPRLTNLGRARRLLAEAATAPGSRCA